ncbi:alpha/beta hydrolase [Aquibium sp. ELW1220]|uniref:alpha/beta fold hydrolase n=1 Tax=Aquibium sp. ELW1220 TaxID=2976766 RepID=UPI0025B1DABD|nr:alpha/beta hydrolase [Aquibium sp. ELW1220]MDN2580486.1 alpha/beta hydrolase [Aquibium sp. ELW1220]
MRRGYLRIGDRHVHYRRTGQGPAVILLHASPVSGAMFLEQLEVFGRHFDAIAIDTPGYGLSTPLDHQKPEIADYADAVVETLDALGLDRAILYGRHTGASIAVETARRHPSRVALALCDGYPVFTPGESERYLTQYLVPVEPQWDGSHLAFWWLRYRDQHVFWPWDLQQTAYRADTDLPDVDFLHRGFTQIMMAGDGYRTAYAAAFRHDSIPALQETRAPVMLTARPGDSLYGAFATVPELHPKRELPRDTIEAAHAEVAIMQTVSASVAPAEPAPAWADAQTDGRYMLPCGQGTLHARLFGTPNGRPPLVVVAPLPGGIGGIEDHLAEIARSWPVLAVEAPGQADSETGDPGSIETSAAWIRQALDAFGCPIRAVLGWEGSAALALEIAAASGASAFLFDPPAIPPALRDAFLDRYTADLTPHVDGRHVPVAWSLLRDERLWAPFYHRVRSAALPAVVGLDATLLHRKAVDLFKQPAMLAPSYRQLWSYPLAERLAERRDGTIVLAMPHDRFAGLCVEGIARRAVADFAGLGALVAKTLSGRPG